uniref:Helix-turn-helix domain-containing protein n=1 Tax=Streptomyces sp. NBC_00180 TaxID=2903632 RepID=A0AAU1I1H0_9ACTN
MTATRPRDKATAVLWLAAGRSQRAAAEAAGVSAGTVREWRKNTVFAGEVERIRLVWERQSRDWPALLAELEEVERRLSPAGARVDESGRFHVTVSIPSGASARTVEQLTACAIARGSAGRAGTGLVVSGSDETASWAREELAELTTVPEYGSAAWHGLEPSDPRRQAVALVLAAERWREQ